MENRFNIRIYGICVKDNKLLVNEEIIRGKKIIKLPGGGLNWGEGAIDCLKREWTEELNVEIEVKDHFYTTDFFQPSAFDSSQVISIYYWVTAELPGTILNNEPNERTYWMDIKEISGETFTLAIDKVVGSLLQQLYSPNTRL